MHIRTIRFGDLEIDPSEIIHFPQGIPGFEQLHRFVLIHPDPNLPLSFLQAADNEELAFIVANPFTFFPDYEFKLTEHVQEELQVADVEDVRVWSVLTIKDNLEEATANLLAPIVMNRKRRLGKQIILHQSEYRTRHKLMASGQTAAAQGKDG